MRNDIFKQNKEKANGSGVAKWLDNLNIPNYVVTLKDGTKHTFVDYMEAFDFSARNFAPDPVKKY